MPDKDPRAAEQSLLLQREQVGVVVDVGGDHAAAHVFADVVEGAIVRHGAPPCLCYRNSFLFSRIPQPAVLVNRRDPAWPGFYKNDLG